MHDCTAWRQRSRHATTILAGLALTALLAACGTGASSSATRGSSAAPSRLAAPPLGAGQVGKLSQVPWGRIGPGWALAEYTTGSSQVAAPVTLYMVDPEGGIYDIYSWSATTQPWQLIDWSGDKTRVLLAEPGASHNTLHQLTMATGLLSTFTLPPTVTGVLGYTRPDGENILVAQDGIARYDLTGAFQAQLSQGGTYESSVVSSPDGLTEVVSGGTGVELVSNLGGIIRWLPVPGTDANAGGCNPVRWWNASDVLVSCMPSQMQVPRNQLWLVPVDGAAPVALTPRRLLGPDFGDIDAWQLPTGLYLQALPGCGPPFLARQSADGAVEPVTVPGSPGPSTVIATADNLMLLQEHNECVAGSSLVWFNPATSSVQAVLTQQPNSTGVISAIAFNGDGRQPS